MARFTTTSAAFIALAVLGGCMGSGNGYKANRGFDSVHQPVVTRNNFVFDVATTGNGIDAAEQARLDAWFDSLRLGYGDRVYVDEPGGYAYEGNRADIGRVAGTYGLLLSDGTPVTTGPVQPGYVRVVVSRSTAEVPGCPDYRNAHGPGAQHTNSSNYGCALNSNWAAMVANPEDLVQGQETTGQGSAATAAKAIDVYRKAPPTGTQGLQTGNTKGD